MSKHLKIPWQSLQSGIYTTAKYYQKSGIYVLRKVRIGTIPELSCAKWKFLLCAEQFRNCSCAKWESGQSENIYLSCIRNYSETFMVRFRTINTFFILDRTFHLLLVFSPAQNMTKRFLADLF